MSAAPIKSTTNIASIPQAGGSSTLVVNTSEISESTGISIGAPEQITALAAPSISSISSQHLDSQQTSSSSMTRPRVSRVTQELSLESPQKKSRGQPVHVNSSTSASSAGLSKGQVELSSETTTKVEGQRNKTLPATSLSVHQTQTQKLEPLQSLSSPVVEKSSYTITAENLKKLKAFIKESGFSGVVYLSDEQNTYKVCSEKFESVQEKDLVFAVHSIGKVYTGVLALNMVQEGVIPEKDLLAPLIIDESLTKVLPPSVQTQMKVATLYKTMIHKGGFCNYLGNYIGSIRKSQESEKPIIPIIEPEEFLRFAEAEIVEVGPSKDTYSNLGMLLVGLSVQHHYQKVDKIGYNAILKKHILDKAALSSFACSKPEHAYFNKTKEASFAPHISGSPAGGYWTSVQDLSKFGQWIAKKCNQEQDFMKLVEEYGQEFYSKEKREIFHQGSIPYSSAYLSSFLDQGITIAIASDKANPSRDHIWSAVVYKAIVNDILKL